MSTASVNGFSATWARVNLPAWGVWYADVELAEPEALTGSVELTVADLVLTGTILSGGANEDRSRYRIAGGAGGWGEVIAAKSYTNDAGVKKSTLIRDAATDAGETMDTDSLPSSTSTAGPHWARASAPAPDATTSGNTPRMNENAVIRMGRKRCLADSIAES